MYLFHKVSVMTSCNCYVHDDIHMYCSTNITEQRQNDFSSYLSPCPCLQIQNPGIVQYFTLVLPPITSSCGCCEPMRGPPMRQAVCPHLLTGQDSPCVSSLDQCCRRKQITLYHETTYNKYSSPVVRWTIRVKSNVLDQPDHTIGLAISK